MKKIACIIPARLHSSRFPKKIIAPLHGKPLLQWVWEAASQIPFFTSVTLAIDAQETKEVVQQFGGRYQMTSPDCLSGSHRLSEIIDDLEGDIFVNWQADEPFVTEGMIRELLQTVNTDRADVWTLKKKIDNPAQALSPHIAKIVTDRHGYALYFSRSLIPFDRDGSLPTYEKHIGLYAYRRQALEKIGRLLPCMMAEAEQLEQLNFLYHGLAIRAHDTLEDGFGIDLPEHLEQAHHKLLGKAINDGGG